MPSTSRYAIFASLITGMAIAAWRTNRFKLALPNVKQNTLHLVAGVFMGLGASLAMGGNDSQLLLALPAFSPAGFVAAGFVAVGSMLVGIWVGLLIRERYLIKDYKVNIQ